MTSDLGTAHAYCGVRRPELLTAQAPAVWGRAFADADICSTAPVPHSGVDQQQ
ncbi:hypothetical protein [Streptomyces sp. NPDC054872]